MLTDDQLAAIRLRKNRFMGQWTGTAGSLAADCHHLMEDRKTMEATIDTLKLDNAELRSAVSKLPEAGCCDGGKCHTRIDDEPASIPVDWILQGDREMRHTGDGILNATPDEDTPQAEQLLLDTLEVIRDRRPKYGGPKAHFARTVGMINAAFADILARPLTEADWAQIMILDKIARYNGPNSTTDGPIDIAGYAACLAEVARP